MRTLIDAAFSRASTVTLLLALILAVGAYAYVSIPKESTPEIPIPNVYVSTGFKRFKGNNYLGIEEFCHLLRGAPYKSFRVH